jgi:hypothetical protein
MLAAPLALHAMSIAVRLEQVPDVFEARSTGTVRRKVRVSRVLIGEASTPPIIRDYYVAATQPDAEQGLALALAATVTRATLDEYIDVMRDSSNGESRVLLVRAPKCLREPRGLAALEALASYPQLGEEISRFARGLSPND